MKDKNTYSKNLTAVAEQFALGRVNKSRLLEEGLVNQSFRVETDKGIFILQRLNPIWDERVIGDYCAVQRYLRTNGLHVPVLLNSRTNGNCYRLDDYIWRAFEYIPNDAIQQPTPELAYEAGKMIGTFHRLMKNSTFKPTFRLPGFHDTPAIIQRLKKTFGNKDNQGKARVVTNELKFICDNIAQHYIPEDMQKIIIHGDPKFFNFLFKDGKAISLLDLDTMMKASPLVDLGDALRSWCRKKPSTSVYQPEIFESAIKGYNQESPIHYSHREVMSSVGLFALELSARYLIDYFDETYFLLSPKYSSRAEQGITRCRRYIEYYKNLPVHKI